MTPEEHKQRHVELHKKLDELVADRIIYDKDFLPTKSTVMELIEWSYHQTLNPTPSPEERTTQQNKG